MLLANPPPPLEPERKVGRSGSRSCQTKVWSTAGEHILTTWCGRCTSSFSHLKPLLAQSCPRNSIRVKNGFDGESTPLRFSLPLMASHSETAVIFKPGRSLKLHVHINNHDRLSDATHSRLDGSLRRRADSELSSLSANMYGHVPTFFFHTRRRVRRRIHCTLEETKETRIHDVSGVQPQNSQKAQPSHSYNNPPPPKKKKNNASIIALCRRFSTATRKCCTQHCSRHDHEVTWDGGTSRDHAAVQSAVPQPKPSCLHDGP